MARPLLVSRQWGGILHMSDLMTYLSTRMAWYRLPEMVMAVFALGSAFAVLVLTAVAHHWPKGDD